ncbi:hypothetical protein [Myxosarcina sp. GI1]|uniref:hypothetical protein n=1 Tax=Myxosarcina sp. GI1 TaxID=1541065 RepID=UPI00055AA989|nr:hypothetical protein [Myxosarcina sp. GI1]
MQNKQKVTLYIPPELHRKLKIKAALDIESMSALVERAISFYLHHPEKVEEVELIHGKTHQVHFCPECDSALVMRDGEMVSISDREGAIAEEIPLEVRSKVDTSERDIDISKSDKSHGETLVSCI